MRVHFAAAKTRYLELPSGSTYVAFPRADSGNVPRYYSIKHSLINKQLFIIEEIQIT